MATTTVRLTAKYDLYRWRHKNTTNFAVLKRKTGLTDNPLISKTQTKEWAETVLDLPDNEFDIECSKLEYS